MMLLLAFLALAGAAVATFVAWVAHKLDTALNEALRLGE